MPQWYTYRWYRQRKARGLLYRICSSYAPCKTLTLGRPSRSLLQKCAETRSHATLVLCSRDIRVQTTDAFEPPFMHPVTDDITRGMQGGVPRKVTSFLFRLAHIICLFVGSSHLIPYPCHFPALPKIPLSIPPRTPLPLPSTSRKRLLMLTEKYCRPCIFHLPSYLPFCFC